MFNSKFKEIMIKKKKSTQSDVFTLLCKKEMNVECLKEFRFHPKRKWRFDYAIPEYKVAIEIDGGLWKYGRHNRPAGYKADMEKLNAAASLGWSVLRFTPDEQYLAVTLGIIKNTIGRIIIENEKNLKTVKQ